MPFLFRSYEAADKVLDGTIGAGPHEAVRQGRDWSACDFLDNGFRDVTNSKQPVKAPADLKGMKIRTMESPTHLAIWRAIGANPTPMAWPIITQLQQGVIDGQENPISVITAAKLNEAGQKYLSLTRHVYSALVIVGEQGVHGQTAPRGPKAFFEAAKAGSLTGRAYMRDNEAEAACRPEGRRGPGGGESRPRRLPREDRSVPAALTGDTKKIYEEIRKEVK